MDYRTPLEEAVMKCGCLKGEIAVKVGIRPATLSELISGKRKPDILTALRLAKFLGKSVEGLWGYLVKEDE